VWLLLSDQDESDILEHGYLGRGWGWRRRGFLGGTEPRSAPVSCRLSRACESGDRGESESVSVSVRNSALSTAAGMIPRGCESQRIS
jgi:hypothetical protein